MDFKAVCNENLFLAKTLHIPTSFSVVGYTLDKKLLEFWITSVLSNDNLSLSPL